MEIIVPAIIVLAIFLFITNNKKTSDNKITNNSASFYDILEDVKKFTYLKEDKYKNSYTEKSVQKQLLKYLQKKYETVTDEYTLEGSAGRIDIDVAKGKAGIELKDALQVIKASNQKKLLGQIDIYKESRYKEYYSSTSSYNLIVLIAGEKEYQSHSTIQEIEHYCRKKEVIYIFCKV